jgi:hypothetical protein
VRLAAATEVDARIGPWYRFNVSTLLVKFHVKGVINLPYDDTDPDRYTCVEGQILHRAVLYKGEVSIERCERDRMGDERWVEVEMLGPKAAAAMQHLAAQLDEANARLAGKP